MVLLQEYSWNEDVHAVKLHRRQPSVVCLHDRFLTYWYSPSLLPLKTTSLDRAGFQAHRLLALVVGWLNLDAVVFLESLCASLIITRRIDACNRSITVLVSVQPVSLPRPSPISFTISWYGRLNLRLCSSFRSIRCSGVSPVAKT